MSYADFVKAQCSRNPSLMSLHNFLSNPRVNHGNCRVDALDFREGTRHPNVRRGVNAANLHFELQENPHTETKHGHAPDNNQRLQGRVLIIEDLTKDIIELLGSALDIDPLFFAMHLHTVQVKGTPHQSPSEATLPSRLLFKNFFNIYYHQTITCDAIDRPRRKVLRDTNIDRKLAFLPANNIGFIQHSVSVLRVEREYDFWLAIVLVDPPLSDKYFSNGAKGDDSNTVYLPSQPYLGGYEDFLEPPPFSDISSSPSSALRISLCHDLAQYWTRQIPDCFDANNPTLEALAYYPLRIVAAEWMKYIGVMFYCMKQYETQTDRIPDLEQIDAKLRALQSWRRRSMSSFQKVQFIIRHLETHMSPSSTDLRLLISDFEYIRNKIEDYGRRLETMLPVLTSTVQILDARQSYRETANINRLTVLALVFVPLTYVTGLFSMNSNNAPGGRLFWMYFAVAIPVLLLTGLVARPPNPRAILARLKIWKKKPTPVHLSKGSTQTSREDLA